MSTQKLYHVVQGDHFKADASTFLNSYLQHVSGRKEAELCLDGDMPLYVSERFTSYAFELELNSVTLGSYDPPIQLD